MTLWKMILGVLLFALATAILYVWGLKKSVGQQEDMNRDMLHVCGGRVVKYLKKHDTISDGEIAARIEGVSVRPFWSRKRMTVKCGKEFAPQVIEFLLDQQYVEKVDEKTYRLRR